MLLFNTLERRVRLAKTDIEEANRLITEYQPFVAKTVRDHIGSYVDPETSDEFAVALTAFHEAIGAYDPEKGKFLSFAARVIRLRLIDYYRSRHKGLQEFSLEAAREQDERDLTAPTALRQFAAFNENEQRRYEILSLTEELSLYGITFPQLAKNSPKQESLRIAYQAVAMEIVRSETLLNQLKQTRRLPLKEIENLCNIDRKRLDRGRHYIIACTLVLTGDYQFIKDYLEWK